MTTDDIKGLAENRSTCGGLVRGFVIAGGAAGLAIHETIGANADIEDCLAQAAILLALAAFFRLLALRAAISGGTTSGAHTANLACYRGLPKSPR
jgi:hypothetical protein